MRMLYDSDYFAIVHFQPNSATEDELFNISGKAMLSNSMPAIIPRNGFEIVDKRSGKEVYLDGAWAELFQQHLEQWNKKPPSREEVESLLNKYAELAQTPLHIN